MQATYYHSFSHLSNDISEKGAKIKHPNLTFFEKHNIMLYTVFSIRKLKHGRKDLHPEELCWNLQKKEREGQPF